MFEEWFENLSKASESSLHGQQELFKQWLQQWPAMPQAAPATDKYWSAFSQKALAGSLSDSLNRYRELLDSAWRTAMQLTHQTLRVSEVKSVEDYKRYTDELWRKFSETLQEQIEARLRELNQLAEKWRDVSHRTEP